MRLFTEKGVSLSTSGLTLGSEHSVLRGVLSRTGWASLLPSSLPGEEE